MGVLSFIYLRHWRMLGTLSKFSTDHSSECLSWVETLLTNHWIRRHRFSVSLLRTMLHFGRKYDMKWLRKEAVHCLTLEFPSTLEQWSNHNQFFGYIIDDLTLNEVPELYPWTSLFEVLYLAHEYSITSILPALYLRICLTHSAVSRVVLFGSHLYLNSCIIVSKESSSAFNGPVLQKNCRSITAC